MQQKAAVQWEGLLPDVADVLKAAGARWNEAFAPLIVGVFEDTAKHWRAEAGIAFDVRNLEAEAFFIDYIAQFSVPIQDTSEREISAILQQGQRDGWTVGQMQKALGQLFQQWVDGDVEAAEFAGERLPPWRSEAIARTETTRATSFASDKIYETNGYAREWLATTDDRTRASHTEANGQVRAVGEPFDVGGYQMNYPGDASLGAPPDEFINCRCTVIPVIED